MPYGFAAAAIGSIASGVMGSQASQSAASTEAGAANAATQAQLQMFGQQQADLAPYQAGGTNSLTALQKLLGVGPGAAGASSPILAMLGIGANGQPTGGGINPATFQGSPGYQYQLQQGTNAVTNSAAASGGLGGNALRALQQTGQGLAGQNWQQYLSNVSGGYQGLVSNLANLTGIGESAAAGAGAGALSTGQSIGSNLIGAGAATGAGQIGSANALAGGLGGAGQSALIGSLLSNNNNPGGGVGNFFNNLFSGNPLGQSAGTTAFLNQINNS